jgi:RNA 3'-phosphate cyclase
MISIDGSQGEGGGQILRTAIAFSALTQEPVRIFNIRAKRENPGLRAQHLTGIKAAGKICDAKIKGDELGSREIEFFPGEIKGGNFNFNIGTAGSITLVLQALMIPAMKVKEKVKIQLKGGTDVKWSPTIDYLRFVTLPLLKKFGYEAKIDLLQRGYFPKGGGKVIAEIFPIKNLKPINLMERGKILSLEGISHAHNALEKARVSRRQARTARSLLYNKLCKLNPGIEVKIKQEYYSTLSYGSGLTLWVKTENSILGANALGEKGKSSEVVGQEAAKNLIREVDSKAALDKYMGDQIIPYLALSSGEVKVSEITPHTKTNVEIVNKFGYNLEIMEKKNVISSSK